MKKRERIYEKRNKYLEEKKWMKENEIRLKIMSAEKEKKTTKRKRR